MILDLVIDRLKKHIDSTPDKVIFRYIENDSDRPKIVTFKELDYEAKKVASMLQEKYNKGDRALLLYPAGLDFIYAFLGCLYAGVVAVPAYPPRKNQKIDRLRNIVEDCDAKVILTTDQIYKISKDIFEKDELFSNISLVSTETIEENRPFNEVLVDNEDLAFLQYTSGSTGNPKGVMVSHANISSNLEVIKEFVECDKNSIGTSWLPHFHDMGLIGGVLLPMYVGFEIILMSPLYFLQKPIRWLKVISDYRVNITTGPNFAYELCINNIKDEELKDIDLSSLHSMLNGAEPIYADTLRRFTQKFTKYGFDKKAHCPCYGMAETTLIVTGIPREREYRVISVDSKALKNNQVVLKERDKGSQELVSCGVTRLGHEVAIVDSNMKLLDENMVGEVCVRGASVTKGYWRNSSKTRDDFHNYLKESKEPYLKTGDLGFLYDNELYICGRKKAMMVIRGKNYYPHDIELSTYSSHEALVNMGTAIFSIEKNGLERVVVVQEVKRTYIRKLNPTEVFKAIQEAIYINHEIQAYDIVLIRPGQLKKTSSGKIQRYNNKEAYLENSFSSLYQYLDVESLEKENEYLAPRNETEERLAKIFQEVLSIDKVSINDNFFELGGHSLLAMQLVSRVRSELEIELPLKELFGMPTVEALSLYLQTHGEESSLTKIPLQQNRDNLKLSYAQERLWFLDKFEGGKSTTYHLSAVLTLEGELNREAFNRALKTIVNRHEALRTNFIERDRETLQIIREADRFRVVEIESNESRIDKEIKEILSQPFNLESDMLFKAVLFVINSDKHYLLVNMHHIISDGWSIGVLVKEFTALYSAYSSNQPNPLPPLEIQYADYAVWQKEYLQGELLDVKLNYWRETLGAVEPLALPTTYPRPAIQSNRGNLIKFNIDKEVTKKLNDLSKKYDVTLFMTLLSSFGLLLHRYSGQEEFVIGSPIANRNRAEIEPLIGFFVNTLPLKQKFSSDMSFNTLLQQIKEYTLSAYEYQDVPFEKIVDSVDIPRDTSRSPLFQVMFALQNNPDSMVLELDKLKIESVELENTTSKFDLTMDITEVDEILQCSLEYATDLFSQEYIKSMIEHFKVLLKAIVKDDTQSISKYPLLTKQEEQQLLVEYNNTKVEYPKDKTIHQLFEEQVELNPNSIAVVYKDNELTYQELNTKSNQLAHYLIAQGVEPDTLVAICVDRSLDMIVGLLAILKAGGAYVPIDPTYPKDRVKHMLDDSNAKLLLTQADLEESLPVTNSKTIAIDRLDTTKEKSTNPKTEVTSNNLAYVIYTSGSTGLPKGVMVEHRGVINLVEWHKDKFKISQNSNATQVASMAFDASVWEIFPYLLNSAKLVILPKTVILNIELFLKELLTKEITHAFVPTALAQQFLEKEDLDRLNLKYIFVGGEKLDSFKHNKKYLVSNNYGPTECTVVSLSCILESNSSTPPIGRPINNTQLYILDEEQNLVPKGVVGELYIAGDGLARGYLNQPELTKEKFIENPFNKGTRLYKTGDLVRYLEDGNIEYISRVDDQVQIRGFRVELGEIEEQLLKIEAIKESVVLVKEDKNRNRSLVAYITTKDNQEIDSDIKNRLSHYLPEYMIPVAYKTIDSMPLTPNGKVDKRALAKLEVNIESTTEYIAPRDEIEEKLAKIFQEVLNIERVGIYDNFFELGGHSLLATQLVSRVRSELGVELPLKELFAMPTVEALSIYIQNYGKESSLNKIPLQQDRDNLKLSYAQERLWFLDKFEGGNSTTYHIPAVLKLEGKLNKKALNSALRTIVNRHEALRTNFIEKDNQTLQIIREADRFRVEEIKSKEDSIEAEIKEILSQPFNLESDMLFKAVLFTINSDKYYLLVNMHHIISDGWSIGVLVKEFIALYNAYSHNRENPLPPLEIQYADYAVWQKEYLRGEVLDEKLNYWKERLQGIESLALPTTYPRPAIQSNRGKHINFTIDKEITKKLNSLSKTNDVTLFMTLLSSFGLLMYKYSGQEEFVIGSPIANRNRAEIEPLIGFFVNTLAFKQDFSSDIKFSTLLQQTKEHTLSAYEHQDVPFEKLVDVLDIPRDTSRSPLFQVMFALQNNPESIVLELDKLKIETVEIENATSKFDLTMDITEENGMLQGSLEYATDLFSQEYMESMVEHYKILLEAIVEDETQPISKYPILTKQEEQQLLIEYNNTKAEYPKDKTIHQLFEEQVMLNPDNIAVVYEDEELTYQELNIKSNQLAHYLIAQGVEPDTLVAICVDRSLDMIVGLLAILKAGGAYVPIDPTYPKDRIKYILDDTQAKLLLTQSHLEDRFPKAIAIDTLDITKEKSNNPKTEVDSNNLAYVIYTSGSTGLPKGVMVEHGGVVNLVSNEIELFDITTQSIMLQFFSYGFDFSVSEIFNALCSGIKLAIPTNEQRMPSRLEFYIEKLNVTHAFIPPIVLAELKNSDRLNSLQLINVGGDICPLSVANRWYKRVKFFNTYGPTEATVDASYFLYNDEVLGNSLPIGRPINNTQLYILDRHLNLVPKGVIGELHIAGDGLARGYLNQPELTKEKFMDNPFNKGEKLYKTGDLVRYLEDGNIEYISRIDDQVKIRGFRIELGEIEEQLLNIDEIKESVVLAKEDKNGNKSLVAYITTEENKELDSSSIKNRLSKYLPEYMIPVAYKTIESMPLTPNGKVDKKALAKLDVNIESTKEYVAPRDEIEEKLVQIFQEVLNVERVGIYDNFFELGGHSLLVIELINRLNKLGLDISIQDVFASQKLVDMATLLQKHKKTTLSIPDNLIPKNCNYITPDMLPLLSISQNEIDKIVKSSVGGVENIQDIYPLSSLQEGMLFHHLLNSEFDVYITPVLLTFQNINSINSIIEALQYVIDRHDVMRTSIHSEGLEKAVQVVHKRVKLKPKEIKASANESIKDKMLERMQPHNLYMPLTVAPLLDVEYGYDQENNQYYVLFKSHHIISDHISIEILVQEIISYLNKKTNELPKPLPYRNFIYYTLHKYDKKKAESFFLEKLSDVDEPTLPFGLLNTKMDGDNILEDESMIPLELSQQIRSICFDLKVTPASFFHLAFAIVLAQCSSRDDVVFGTLLSGRFQEDITIDNMMGMFLNTLPIRITLTEKSIEALLVETQKYLFDLINYEQTPLVTAQKCSAVSSDIPLFSAILNYRQSRQNDNNLDINSDIEMVLSQERANYPFTISIDDFGDDFGITTQVDSSINAKQITQYMLTISNKIVQLLQNQPTKDITDISILPPQEKQQLLIEYNDTKAEYPKEKTIHQQFQEQVEHNPNNIAVVYEDKELTYRELNTKSNQLAHYLITQGVEPDTLVAICVDRSLDMIIGLLAILKAGGAYVPIDPTYPKDRVKHMLDDSNAKLLLTQSHLKDTLPQTNSRVIAIDTLDITNKKTTNPKTEVTSSNLAYVIYTSGSTGLPKGVMVEHSGVINLIEWHKNRFKVSKDSKATQVASMAFDASVWEIFSYILNSAKLVILPKRVILNIELFLKQLLAEEITHAFVPTALAQQFLEKEDSDRLNLKYMFVGGEKLDSYKYDKKYLVVNCYGPTESTVISLSSILNSKSSTPPIGRPINNTQIYILDKHQNLVPKGVVGELHIAGDGLARGYLNQPKLTKEKFIENPFKKGERLYKTGDLVRYLEDGNIEYVGRVDDQVKIRGFRIELGEIEQQLLNIDEIKESVVLAKEDKNRNKFLVAYITTKDNQELDSNIKNRLSHYLPEYMIPVAYKTIDSMPLTPNGKIDKKALAKIDVNIESNREYVAPRDETEEKLAKIFQEVLNIEKIGIHDNFFELGGHSLLATQLLLKIRTTLQTEIALHSIFINPTIVGISSYIKENNYKQSLVPLQKNGDKTPIFAVHGLGGNAQQFKQLSNILGEEQPMYAFQDIALTEEEVSYTSVQDIAQQYIFMLKSVAPKEPYKLVGHSIGGLIAYEMASILEKEGKEVESLTLLDCYMPQLLDFETIDNQAKELIDSLNLSYDNYLKLQEVYRDYKLPSRRLRTNISLYIASENSKKEENSKLWKKVNSNITIKELKEDHFSILSNETLKEI